MNKAVIINNIELIYTVSKDVCESYGTETIPMNTLNTIIEKSKISSDEKVLKQFIKKYNNALDTLNKLCVNMSKDFNDKLPLSILRFYTDTMKKTFLA